jgi:hypothetical protein
MASTPIGSVTPDRDILLPPEVQATLQPGDEYLVWQTEDTILLKKVQRPTTIADIRAKVLAIGPDPEEPSLAELSQLVREVRQQG